MIQRLYNPTAKLHFAPLITHSWLCFAQRDTEMPKSYRHMLEDGADEAKVNATLAEKTGTTVHHRKTNPNSIKHLGFNVSMLCTQQCLF